MKKGAMCLVFLMCVMAVAQDKGKNSGAATPADKKAGSEMTMPMAKPSPEMQKLSKIVVGTWSTTEKMEPAPLAPKGASGKGTATFKNGPGGLSLIQDYKSSGTMGSFTGHGVMWWDPQACGFLHHGQGKVLRLLCSPGRPHGCPAHTITGEDPKG